MAIPVSDILTRAGYILNDEDHVRWTEGELIAWINDAAAEAVVLRPSANAVTDTLELNEGTFHEIPEIGIQLLDVIRNVKADDSPGKPVGKSDRRQIDELEPGWYAAKPKSEVKRYTYDDRNARGFYTFPRVKAGTKIKVMYSAAPTKVAADTDNLELNRSYTGAILSYVLYRALSKDSEYANGQIAGTHLQAFYQGLGVRNETAVTASPKGRINDGT